MSDSTETEQRERARTCLPAPSTAPPVNGEVAFETLVEEARLAYRREVATLEAVDEKVMRSVRTAVIVVGFVASAVGVAGPDAVGAASVGVVLGLVLGVSALLAATLRGIAVYSLTARPPRPEPAFRDAALDGAVPAPVARDLLVRYDATTRAVGEDVEASVNGLNRVRRLLRAGIASLSVAAGAFVLSVGYGVDGTVAAASLGLTLLVAASLAGPAWQWTAD